MTTRRTPTGATPDSRAKGQRPSAAEVDSLLAELGADASDTQLRHALGHRHYRPVARAAELVANGLRYALEADLIAALRCFLHADRKRDPGCIAKGALARALVALDCTDTALFREGIRLRQLEPVWGGSIDTAADLRASCAMGLAASADPEVLRDLVDLLADPEHIARSGAVRAIGCTAPEAAEAVLRTKVLLGDAESEVIGECFRTLLALAPDAAPGFVARWLSVAPASGPSLIDPDTGSAADGAEVAELAALALGESRLDAAVALLRETWESEPLRGPRQRVLLRAAALARTEPAFDWLLALAGTAAPATARSVIEELSIYRHHTPLGERLKASLDARADADLSALFERYWELE